VRRSACPTRHEGTFSDAAGPRSTASPTDTAFHPFGSSAVARGDDGPESDIDIAAELPSTISLIGLAGLRRELSDLLGVPVDVVPTSGLRRAVAADLDREGVSL
jgi:predicted nucleotidyltransferase